MLFNDFAVSVVKKGYDMIDFTNTNRIPCILQYVSTGRWIDFWTQAENGDSSLPQSHRSNLNSLVRKVTRDWIR